MNRATHVEDRLPAYLDGRLDEIARAQVAAHLAQCTACARAADAFRAVEHALDTDADIAAPRAMWPAIARRRDPVRRRILDVTFAMATAGALAGGFMLGVLAFDGRGAAVAPDPTSMTASATTDTDWLTSPERSLSDVYFFDTSNGTENAQ